MTATAPRADTSARAGPVDDTEVATYTDGNVSPTIESYLENLTAFANTTPQHNANGAEEEKNPKVFKDGFMTDERGYQQIYAFAKNYVANKKNHRKGIPNGKTKWDTLQKDMAIAKAAFDGQKAEYLNPFPDIDFLHRKRIVLTVKEDGEELHAYGKKILPIQNLVSYANNWIDSRKQNGDTATQAEFFEHCEANTSFSYQMLQCFDTNWKPAPRRKKRTNKKLPTQDFSAKKPKTEPTKEVAAVDFGKKQTAVDTHAAACSVRNDAKPFSFDETGRHGAEMDVGSKVVAGGKSRFGMRPQPTRPQLTKTRRTISIYFLPVRHPIGIFCIDMKIESRPWSKRTRSFGSRTLRCWFFCAVNSPGCPLLNYPSMMRHMPDLL